MQFYVDYVCSVLQKYTLSVQDRKAWSRQRAWCLSGSLFTEATDIAVLQYPAQTSSLPLLFGDRINNVLSLSLKCHPLIHSALGMCPYLPSYLYGPAVPGLQCGTSRYIASPLPGSQVVFCDTYSSFFHIDMILTDTSLLLQVHLVEYLFHKIAEHSSLMVTVQ